MGAKPPVMILGVSHDTCWVCGKDVRMRFNRKLFHHGHPSRPCSGAGKYGVRIGQFVEIPNGPPHHHDGTEKGLMAS